jgi:hypothetical protein
MTTTVSELEAAKARDEALTKLKVERAAAAARLAELDGKLAEAENADFIERLGRMKVSEMTTREKSELVTRLGLDGFLKLLDAR